MAYFTVSLKIKRSLKAQDKEEAAEAFFSEVQELYEAGELDGKLTITKASKSDLENDEDGNEEDDED